MSDFIRVLHRYLEDAYTSDFEMQQAREIVTILLEGERDQKSEMAILCRKAIKAIDEEIHARSVID